jgi:hypothetical protein
MAALAEHCLHLLPAEGTPLAVLVFGGLTADLEAITGIFTDPDKFEELKACSSPSGTAFLAIAGIHSLAHCSAPYSRRSLTGCRQPCKKKERSSLQLYRKAIL